MRLQPATLGRFLAKLDKAGILDGRRTIGDQAANGSNRLYLRWKLFNPDRAFARIVPWLRWIWTRGFVIASLFLIAIAALVALTNWTEFFARADQILDEHSAWVLRAAWLVIVSHEFAHGLTAKAFGGRATEIGGLLIYGCIPALYCNVSGMYLIPQRRRRLWVIAAGVYWQVLVGCSALLAWFLVAPQTLARGSGGHLSRRTLHP